MSLQDAQASRPHANITSKYSFLYYVVHSGIISAPGRDDPQEIFPIPFWEPEPSGSHSRQRVEMLRLT
jgi:hypothetical protein